LKNFRRYEGRKNMGDQSSQLQKGDGLLIIDVQKDFCPGGALAVEKCDRIIQVLNHWIEEAQQRDVPIYVSRDWHPRNHISFREQGGQWPPHCIQESDGAGFHPDLDLPEDSVIITKGVRFDHDQKSVFDETGLAAQFMRDGVTRLIMGGLALDVCVLASVMDARKAGLAVQVIRDATRPIDENNARNALSKIKVFGAEIITTGDVGGPGIDACQKAPEWAEHARFDDTDEACDDGRSGKI
jgi:nicotinamidase/pyrazinamidase